jgi:hypothetical protein
VPHAETDVRLNRQIHVNPQATGTKPTGQTPTTIWNIYVGTGWDFVIGIGTPRTLSGF